MGSALSRPHPDTVPQPNQNLRQRATAFVDVLRAAIKHEPKALKALLLEVLGDEVAGAMADLIADHERRSHRGGVQTFAPSTFRDNRPGQPIARFTGQLEQDWRTFWSRYRRRACEASAREEFRKLPWQDPGFRGEFFAGLERWERSRDWAKQFVCNPDRWLREQLWHIDNSPIPADESHVEAKHDAEKARSRALIKQVAESPTLPADLEAEFQEFIRRGCRQSA